MKSKTNFKNLFKSEEELAKFLLDNVTDSLKQAIRVVVNIMIKQEMKQLREELDKKLSFNGTYLRDLISTAGKVNDIPIPRFREIGQSDLPLNSTQIFEKEKDAAFRLIAEMHRQGISQRKIAKLCRENFGFKISKNKVGEVHRELAQKEELQINNQPLDDNFDYLIIDGIWAKAKNFGISDKNKAVLLCALGVRPDGSRKIIAFKAAYSEAEKAWIILLKDIKQRGLKGKNLKLIISDDNLGLQKGLDQIYPNVPVQSCIVHKMRNVIMNTSYKNRKTIAEEVKLIYNCEDKKTAEEAAEKFCRKWYVAEEKTVRSLRYNFDRTLTYMDFDKSLWQHLRTTNLLEREFREVRRRIKVFDNSFDSHQSLNNYANSIFDYLNNNYPACQHTYTQ